MKHNFRDLGIWKDSFAIVKDVYDLCIKLPSEEKYGLKSQIQRCATSIPSNIAEGSGRTSDKEFLHFLNIAISSSYRIGNSIITL
jgi:four helix bundle protein